MQPVGSDVTLDLTSWEAASSCVYPTVCGPIQKAPAEVCKLPVHIIFLDFLNLNSNGPVSSWFLLIT